MKRKILLAIAQFEDIYSEWDDYSIQVVKNDRVAIYDTNTKIRYNIIDAKELLTDFKGVLKQNNLMFSSYGKTTGRISLYLYSFETDYEELADQIERGLGNKITNLVIYKNRSGRPHIKFQYASNITSGEKNQIRKKVEEFVNEFIENQKYFEEE